MQTLSQEWRSVGEALAGVLAGVRVAPPSEPSTLHEPCGRRVIDLLSHDQEIHSSAGVRPPAFRQTPRAGDVNVGKRVTSHGFA